MYSIDSKYNKNNKADQNTFSKLYCYDVKYPQRAPKDLDIVVPGFVYDILAVDS